MKLKAMTTHVSAAPTTSENLTLTLISSHAGSAFDTVIYTIDLAAASTVDDVNTNIDLPLVKGDALKLTYPNTDGGTLGIQVILTDRGE
jgi:hypothetical protein